MLLVDDSSDIRYALLFEVTKEEHRCSLFFRQAFGIADDAILTVTHGAVAFYLSGIGVVAVTHGTVVLHLTHVGVVAVAELSVTHTAAV